MTLLPSNTGASIEMTAGGARFSSSASSQLPCSKQRYSTPFWNAQCFLLTGNHDP